MKELKQFGVKIYSLLDICAERLLELKESSLPILESLDYRINVSIKDLRIFGSLDIYLENDLIVSFPENDIFYLEIIGERVIVKCTVYSDFGLDEIVSLDGNIYEITPSCLDKIEGKLVQSLEEHIAFYIA